MPDATQTLKRLISDLEVERQRLIDDTRRVDVDIAEATQILARREGSIDIPSPDRGGRAAPPGAAQREVVRLMSDGEIWSPAKLGTARGTSAQAAGAIMKRLSRGPHPVVESLGDGQYRLVSPQGGEAQESLPGSPGSDEHISPTGNEVGGS